MGSCWCKDKTPEDGDGYDPPDRIEVVHQPAPYTDYQMRIPKVVDPVIIDNLILEMLKLIAAFVDTDEESPVSLVKLHVIADKEDGWLQVISSLLNVIPLEYPFGPTAISIMFDDCPLPAKSTILRLTHILDLSTERAKMPDINVRFERNICVVLGCIADKLAGPNSVAVLTSDILDFLVQYLKSRRQACITLHALLALEKFAQTTENKLTIRNRLDREAKNPLLALEKFKDSEDPTWREVGFCANWALDNVFLVKDRPLSYEGVDLSSVNAMLNSHDVSEYLKIRYDGLEARCDTNSFESVRCTFQVDEGCWYYEATLMTPGVIQIGWATKNTHFRNHEGYGIGDDLYSLSYDGCRRLVWYRARPTSIDVVRPWRPSDVVGCLIDMDNKEAIFTLNGFRIQTCREIFQTTRLGFYAAASFMAFQHCRFNFGQQPFKYPPSDRPFSTFNDFGVLTNEEKQVNSLNKGREEWCVHRLAGQAILVIPRRLVLEQLRQEGVRENACTLCFNDNTCCILQPCGHKGFCSMCTSQLKYCPLCRAAILYVQREDAA